MASAPPLESPAGTKLPCDGCGQLEDGLICVEVCEHSVCKGCIQEAANKSKVREVSCPVVQRGGRLCGGGLTDDDIKKSMDRKTFKEWRDKDKWRPSVCYNAKCKKQFLRKRFTRQVSCPDCREPNCADCMVIHRGMTCAQYIQKYVGDMDAGRLEDPKEKEKRYRELVAAYQQECIPTTEEFECPRCLVEVEIGTGIILRNCFHSICKECVANAAKESASTKVLCPYDKDNVKCTMEMLSLDIQACMTKDDYAAHCLKPLKPRPLILPVPPPLAE